MSGLDVGALSTGRLAHVDERGAITWKGAQLTWRVWVGDRWIVPAGDGLARSARPALAPVAETALRIAGGDAIQRVYAVDETVVVEVENASPEAIAVAFALTTDQGSGDAVQLSLPRKPGATEPDGAVVFPVPHRTTIRVAAGPEPVNVSGLANVDSVIRGWDRILDRGMRTELPEPLQSDVDEARADLLLAPPAPEVFATLEAWGFDAEAITMWSHFGLRERRAARRLAGGIGLLANTREMLVSERGKIVVLLAGFNPGWLGQNLAVHHAPVKAGPVSFAVRWHGSRPALLWDVPRGVTIRVPAFDSTFASSEPEGETLLAEPAGTLLSLGARVEQQAESGDDVMEAPEEFS